ncbi:EpsG family protein [Sphingobacterium multivorum]|uniref:EpsG family protein n=1 Tax=Sphingobacterium multivorum TaxID=28454 RepID=UPI0028A0B2D4|nr:EpsG family protein [Sphingobacterium multivorum]
MEYIVIGGFFCVLSFIEILKYNRFYSSIILLFFSVVMILFVSLRNGEVVGTDSPAYFFNYIYPFDFTVEYGYKYVAAFFSKVLNADYTIFLIFINTLSIFLISSALKRNSYFLVFPLLIYYSDFYLYYNFSGVRQAIALSFSTFAIYYAYHRNYKAFFLLVLCAISFHISAIVFALAIFVPKKTLTVRNYLYLIALSLIAFGAIGYVIEHNEYISNKFKYYSDVQENSTNILMLFIVGLLKRSIILVLIILVGRKLFKNQRFVYLFNLYLLGIIIYVSTYLISPDFGVRFSSYFTVVDMLLVGNMLYLGGSNSNKIIIFTVISIMIFYKISTYAFLDMYNYKFVF